MKKAFNILDARHVAYLAEFVQQNWEAMAKCGAPMRLEITDAKAKRSTQANKRHWAIMGQISDEAWLEGRQYSPEVWHDFFCRRFIGIIDVPGAASMAESSSRLNTLEFTLFDEKIEAFMGTDLGLVPIEPFEPMGR